VQIAKLTPHKQYKSTNLDHVLCKIAIESDVEKSKILFEF